MNIAYTLNKNIEADKLVKAINSLLSSIPNQEISDHVLVISINKISDYSSDSLLPKITYTPDCNT